MCFHDGGNVLRWRGRDGIVTAKSAALAAKAFIDEHKDEGEIFARYPVVRGGER
jgi:hypothetical protein